MAATIFRPTSPSNQNRRIVKIFNCFPSDLNVIIIIRSFMGSRTHKKRSFFRRNFLSIYLAFSWPSCFSPHFLFSLQLRDAKLLLKEDDDLITAVFEYWSSKRRSANIPLLPVIKSEKRDGSTTNNPYVAFRYVSSKLAILWRYHDASFVSIKWSAHFLDRARV